MGGLTLTPDGGSLYNCMQRGATYQFRSDLLYFVILFGIRSESCSRFFRISLALKVESSNVNFIYKYFAQVLIGLNRIRLIKMFEWKVSLLCPMRNFGLMECKLGSNKVDCKEKLTGEGM